LLTKIDDEKEEKPSIIDFDSNLNQTRDHVFLDESLNLHDQSNVARDPELIMLDAEHLINYHLVATGQRPPPQSQRMNALGSEESMISAISLGQEANAEPYAEPYVEPQNITQTSEIDNRRLALLKDRLLQRVNLKPLPQVTFKDQVIVVRRQQKAD
jgi:hypothetical protein